MRMELVDRRIGGCPRYFIGDESEELVQVPLELLRCIAYVCARARTGARQWVEGTAYFVSVEESGEMFWYLVTVAHVVDAVHAKPSGDREIYIRLNTRSGGTRMVRTKYKDWLRHEDAGNDVAVYRWPSLGSDLDHLAWPITVQMLDDLVGAFQIGPGDDIVFPGLFAQVPGQRQSLPIVRVGNIAAKCDEPIFLKDIERDIQKSFLIEARSIPGISGSPVFVHMGHTRQVATPDGRERRDFMGIPLYWMGMIHGHYDDKARPGRRGRNPINVGIALVIPYERVVDVIKSPEETRARQDIASEKRKGGGPSADRTKPAPAA